MSYLQARRAGVALALRPWLRRVGLGLLLTLAALSGGAGDLTTALHALASSAAWTVLPLQWAGFAAPLLQAVAVLLLLLALQPLLQPARWLEWERSLPLPPALLRRSDAELALLALSPLALLQGAGLLALQRPLLALAWALGSALGLGLGVLALHRRRWPPTGRQRHPAFERPAAASLRRLSPSRALLLLPLWRGPLRGSAAWLAGQALLLAALPALLGLWLPPTGVAMAWVALAWLGLQRSNARLDAEAAALWAALPPLPLDVARWQQRLRALALLPWVVALPLAAVQLLDRPLRPAVALALLLALTGLGLWSALTRWRADDAHLIRQLLGLALLLALASELFA